MVRYRLQLHAPMAGRTLIAEARTTFSGRAKRAHIAGALSAAELARYNVRLVEVPRAAMHGAAMNCSERACAQAAETAQRVSLNRPILEELAASPWLTHVYFSDVDELLDLEAMGGPTGPWHHPSCVSPKQRLYIYGLRCVVPMWANGKEIGWARSVLAEASWLAGLLNRSNNATELRNPNSRWYFPHFGVGWGTCKTTRNYTGWHLTHFLPTDQALSKLRSYAHAFDRGAGKGRSYYFSPASIMEAKDPQVEYEHRVSECIGIGGPAHPAAWPYDGRLPPNLDSSLPSHPLAPALTGPRASNISLDNWKQFEATNCYVGKGGVPIVRRDPYLEYKTLVECQRACDAHAKSKPSQPCIAVVFSRGGVSRCKLMGCAPDGPERCWLRSAIHLNDCVQDDEFTTYVHAVKVVDATSFSDSAWSRRGRSPEQRQRDRTSRSNATATALPPTAFPTSVPPACDATSFPTNLGDTQCAGLSRHAARSEGDCCAACLSNSDCVTYSQREPNPQYPDHARTAYQEMPRFPVGISLQVRVVHVGRSLRYEPGRCWLLGRRNDEEAEGQKEFSEGPGRDGAAELVRGFVRRVGGTSKVAPSSVNLERLLPHAVPPAAAQELGERPQRNIPL
jgi:hypothetical protein